jgi:hypothetical protein
MDPFVYLLEYRVIVYIECKHAVLPSNVDTYLQDENTYNITKENKRLVVYPSIDGSYQG